VAGLGFDKRAWDNEFVVVWNLGDMPTFSLPILIATWKFLDPEAFGQDWQGLRAKQM
jgi:hypothetical protein